MEVILNKDVPGVGKSGAVVKVKDGYGRNYLIPDGLALPLTSGNLKKIAQDQKHRDAQLEKARNDAEGLKARLASLSLTISVLTQPDEKLYGAISQAEIERALKDEGIDIDKTAILIDEPIKALGIYEVPVKLHPDVQAKVKVWVVKK